jgi:hypothetical protein
LKIKSQIKSPYFNMILKISKSSQNDLKSDFVKSSIKSLNTLPLSHPQRLAPRYFQKQVSFMSNQFLPTVIHFFFFLFPPVSSPILYSVCECSQPASQQAAIPSMQ